MTTTTTAHFFHPQHAAPHMAPVILRAADGLSFHADLDMLLAQSAYFRDLDLRSGKGAEPPVLALPMATGPALKYTLDTLSGIPSRPPMWDTDFIDEVVDLACAYDLGQVLAPLAAAREPNPFRAYTLCALAHEHALRDGSVTPPVPALSPDASPSSSAASLECSDDLATRLLAGYTDRLLSRRLGELDEWSERVLASRAPRVLIALKQFFHRRDQALDAYRRTAGDDEDDEDEDDFDLGLTRTDLTTACGSAHCAEATVRALARATRHMQLRPQAMDAFWAAALGSMDPDLAGLDQACPTCHVGLRARLVRLWATETPEPSWEAAPGWAEEYWSVDSRDKRHSALGGAPTVAKLGLDLDMDSDMWEWVSCPTSERQLTSRCDAAAS